VVFKKKSTRSRPAKRHGVGHPQLRTMTATPASPVQPSRHLGTQPLDIRTPGGLRGRSGLCRHESAAREVHVHARSCVRRPRRDGHGQVPLDGHGPVPLDGHGHDASGGPGQETSGGPGQETSGGPGQEALRAARAWSAGSNPSGAQCGAV